MRQIEFTPAVEADLVCALSDREYAAHMTVAAAENKLEYNEEQFHKSCALATFATSVWANCQMAKEQHQRWLEFLCCNYSI